MNPDVTALFEGSTPLARRLADAGPHSSPADLIADARTLVAGLSEEERIATLNAHPRIGERPEHLSKASLGEQGADVLADLDELNAEYERRFGFRFVVFVNRRSKTEILEVLRMRLENGRQAEMEAGLRAVVDIAADRLVSL